MSGPLACSILLLSRGVQGGEIRHKDLGIRSTKIKVRPHSLLPSEAIHGSGNWEEVLLDLPTSTALNLGAKLTGSLCTLPQDSKGVGVSDFKEK